MAIISPDQFSLELVRDGGHDVIRVTGELDVATAPVLRQELNRMIDEPDSDSLTLDLGRMTFIDSTGLSVLLGGLRRLREKGRDLTLANPTQSTIRVLEIVGFTGVFTIVTGTAETTTLAT